MKRGGPYYFVNNRCGRQRRQSERGREGGREGGRAGPTFNGKNGAQTGRLENLGLEHDRGGDIADGIRRVEVEVLKFTGHPWGEEGRKGGREGGREGRKA